MTEHGKLYIENLINALKEQARCRSILGGKYIKLSLEIVNDIIDELGELLEYEAKNAE